METYLFAYGTLRPGLAPPNAQHLVKSSRPIGVGSAPGRLYDFGPYPGAIFDPAASTQIKGDVLALPEDAEVMLAQLDVYEGYLPDDAPGSLFVRIRQTVTLADGREFSCWAYRYNQNVRQAPLVAGGEYARRLS
jgi:gamma-glutamylcyclotransferase (GGCT)/AIG2-like uncharacterized protein YtfP